ncbi:T9SS type A sorting domain-containing protein [Algoriphagus sp. CAU 1675]|uniref:T9SS type A sorting domain-containing protein n=1 Tax=Algoriphagus sp. CAU 1675 TaxID=3032597 RepID=UPI0023DA448A|nr:T9SS type A sorting domain-containing protein [Algoriphagus sp. CAU 1675]MDF2158673.1 T9SS type A sorting domain-containing protein [Algoriphagus sp. CAU 1675]
MKTFLKFFTWLMLVFPFFSEAQQVRVLSEGLEFNGDIGTSQRKTILLQNESNQTKTFFLKNLSGNIGSSQDMKICIGEQCFDAKRDLAKIKFTLLPGEVITDLYLDFGMGIAETKGSFDLVFVNQENIRDAFVVEVRYDVANPNASVDDFDYEDLILSDVYPNPSNRVAQLDYKIKNRQVKAKIAINSFIGNPVGEYELDEDRSSLVINVSDFKPGVYFYTLFVDNKNIVTKKLVVKK